MSIKKINTIQDLHDLFDGHEIMIIGDHEWAGTVTKYQQMVNQDGSIPALTDLPNKKLRMRVKTPFGVLLDLDQKNIFVIVDKIKLKQQPRWN